MKVEKLSLEEVQQQYQEYSYALVYEISRMLFIMIAGDSENAEKIKWDEILEARFFSKEGEIHLYNDGDGVQAIKVTDEASDHTLDISFVMNKVPTGVSSHNRRIVEREYLGYDKDGQIYIQGKRLFDAQAIEQQ